MALTPAHDAAAVGNGVALGEDADELHGGLSSVEVDALHQLHQLVAVVGGVEIPGGHSAVVSHILAHLDAGHGDHADAGAGPFLKEGQGVLGGIEFPVGHGVHGGGGGDNAVFQNHIADPDGGQGNRIFCRHTRGPPYRLGSMSTLSWPLRSPSKTFSTHSSRETTPVTMPGKFSLPEATMSR